MHREAQYPQPWRHFLFLVIGRLVHTQLVTCEIILKIADSGYPFFVIRNSIVLREVIHRGDGAITWIHLS
jgi:hypothetical protein